MKHLLQAETFEEEASRYEVQDDILLRVLVGVDVMSRVNPGSSEGSFHISVLQVDHKDICVLSLVTPFKSFKDVKVFLQNLGVINDDGIEEEDCVVLSDGEAVDV